MCNTGHLLKSARTGFYSVFLMQVYSSIRALSKIDPVSCPVTNMAFVAIKMGRRSGGCPAAAGREERSISRLIRDQSAAAGQPLAHFHRNPPGRGQLAVFPRCSLLTYPFRYARRSRFEKQPTDPAAAGRKPMLAMGQDT